jgi:hypothetical protein
LIDKGKPGGKNDASLPQKKMERTEAMKASFSFTARFNNYFLLEIHFHSYRSSGA